MGDAVQAMQAEINMYISNEKRYKAELGHAPGKEPAAPPIMAAEQLTMDDTDLSSAWVAVTCWIFQASSLQKYQQAIDFNAQLKTFYGTINILIIFSRSLVRCSTQLVLERPRGRFQHLIRVGSNLVGVQELAGPCSSGEPWMAWASRRPGIWIWIGMVEESAMSLRCSGLRCIGIDRPIIF